MALFAYLAIVIIVVLFIYLVIDVVSKNRAVKNVKGPTYGALLKALFQKKRGQDIFFHLQRFAKEYPRLYKAWIWPKLLVVTDDCDVIQRVLNSKEMLHKPTMVYEIFDFPMGLVGSKLPIWRRHRKILNPTFNLKILESFIPIFEEKSKLMADEMGQHLEEPAFDAMKIVMKYTLEAVFGTTMGFEGMTNAVLEKICNSFREILTLIRIRFKYMYLLPALTYKLSNCFNGHYKKEQKIREFLYDYVNQTILEKQANFDGSLVQEEDSIIKPQLFINQLISLSEDKQRDIQLTNTEIKDEVYIMLAGGTETTALTVSYMSILLGQNPDLQEKLFNEINEHYPSFDEPLTMEILNSMTYLEMSIKETLRLIPIIPFIGREVMENFDLGPCTITPGMMLVINIYSLHRRKDIWGDDAEEYNPERFSVENMANKHPYSFIPFSAGVRNCIGNRYAMMSMKIMVIYIMKNYKIKTKLKLNELRFYFTLTLHLFNHHLIQIERRTPKDSVAKTNKKTVAA